MNPFISPIAIQDLCDFFSSLVGILINIENLVATFASPLGGLAQIIVPNTQSLISQACFVVVAQATGAGTATGS